MGAAPEDARWAKFVTPGSPIADWRDRHARGESFKSIARAYGAHATTVSRTLRGIQRKQVSA